MRAIDDGPHGYGDSRDGRGTTRRQAALIPILLAVGAVLLMCAALLPGPSRLIVLPAVLLAPGYAFLRVLGRPVDLPSISLAVPVSIVLIVCGSLLLYVSHIRLGPVSLGLLLGVVTALCLGGSYGRELRADRSGPDPGQVGPHRRSHRRQPPDDWDLPEHDADVTDRRRLPR
jgi:hypothetical protein